MGPDGESLVLTPQDAEILSEKFIEWAQPERQIEVWGRPDIQRECGIASRTAYNWIHDPTFPAPLAKTGRGPIWDPKLVRGWVKHRKRKQGRPVKRIRPVARG